MDRDKVFDVILGGLVVLHVFVCPFTKVEESFNLQATHDILEYGISKESLNKYDHFSFPGVVPRTFIGPLLLGGAAYPIVELSKWLNSRLQKLWIQYLVRIILGLSTVFATSKLREAIKRSFGRPISIGFMLLSMCQFHTIFWVSRTLPNMFAFPLTILALSHWVLSTTSANPYKHIRWLITYATIASVIFRFEVVLALGPILLYTSMIHKIGFTEVAVGASVGLASLVTSLVIDSYFWQTPWMWPEGSVFYFNAILGKSVEWGVSPFHTYFTVFIPKLLVASFPLSIFSVIVDKRTRLYISPIMVFVAGFSLLGHKEWRFVVYVVPVFNLCAAVGWVWIEQKASKLLYRIVRYIIIVALILSFISSTGILIISSYNYPGGAALFKLHNIEKNYTQARVHLDVYTAMTGASRFGESRKDWIYSKEESHFTPEDYSNYTHILTHTPLFHKDRFVVVDVVYGYEKVKRKSVKEVIETLGDITTRKADGERIKMDYDGLKVFATGLIDTIFRLFPIEIVIEPKVWIMKSKTA